MSSRIADRRGRPARQPRSHARRGAAMIIVIAIMTILLAIALTFFTVTKLEVQTATNVRNIVDVDLLADAAIAITQAHLNQDLFRHPEYTSLDHGWKTLFNGAAYVGKDWAMAPGANLQNKGLPEVDHTNLPVLVFDDGHRETLFGGPYSRDWKAIPRFEGTTLPIIYRGPEGQRVITNGVLDPVTGTPRAHARFDDDQSRFPFVTSSLYGQPEPTLPDVSFTVPPKEGGLLGDRGAQYAFEQIHEWTDVDNDDDGFRDSLWLPIPRDVFFGASNADNDLDGLIDESQDNGLNDDRVYEALDSTRRTDNQPLPAEIAANPNAQFFTNDPDEAIEAGTFVYYGGDDGLDNDRDGFIDTLDSAANGAPQPWEYDASNFTVGYFLTAPLPGIQMAVDFDADGIVPDTVPIDVPGNVILAELRVQLPNTVRVLVANPNNPSEIIPVLLTAQNVDRLDNDFDLSVNDYYAYAYVGPNESLDAPPFRLAGFTEGTQTSAPEIIIDNAAFNSYSQSGAPIPTEYAGSFYAIWRHVGNWYISQDGLADADLFTAARKRGYAEINTDTTFDLDGDGTPELQIVAVSGTQIYTNPSYDDGNGNSVDYGELREYLRVTHSGEPVCELVGRMAVLVTDEASKPNINTIGGHTYEDEFNRDSSNPGNINTGGTVGPIKRALNDGATTAEYETRIIPDVGIVRAAAIDATRNGAPAGVPNLPVNPSVPGDYLGAGGEPTDFTLRMGNGTYYADVAFPGYGRADDNGNAFLLSVNGIDDDGDGLVDEGIFLPELSPNAYAVLVGDVDISTFAPDNEAVLRDELNLWKRYYRQLGHFEGIDEPGEYQSFAAHRHEIAERDEFPGGGPIDNDDDGVANEIGELGDQPIRTRNQIRDAYQIGSGIGGDIANFTSNYSTSKNINLINTESGLRGLNKLDPNYATAQQLAATAILSDEKLSRVTDYRFPNPNSDAVEPTSNYVENPIVHRFAEGLRQKDVHLSAPGFIFNGNNYGGFMFIADNVFTPTPNAFTPGVFYNRDISIEDNLFRFPADPLLKTMQAAVDTVDNRDRDHARTTLTTENRDLIPEEPSADPINDPNPVPFPETQNNRERVDDTALFPVEAVQDQLADILGETSGRILESIDEWWANYVRAEVGQPASEERRISYTTTGLESIVINELMVRPVRRVEAEMIAGTTSPNQNRFDPSPLFDADAVEFSTFVGAAPGTQIHVLPYFDVQWSTVGQVLASQGFTLSTPAGWGVDGFAVPEAQVLGDDVWIETSNAVLNVDVPSADPDTDTGVDVGNVLQYFIRPSDGLPPGRYYLTINIDNGTVDDNTELAYAIKYVNFGDPTIVDEIVGIAGNIATNGIDDSDTRLDNEHFNPLWAQIPPAHYSHKANIPGEPQGWVFIDGTPDPDTNPNTNMDDFADLNSDGYYIDGGISFAPALAVPPATVGRTHTVTVPTAASGIALCIAVRKVNDDGIPLAINYLDFSQEPDHEYIELANNSDEEIDLGGWELEVGIPDAPGVPIDPNKSTWRVPDGTRIAPNGMLLLGFNKFDYHLSPMALSSETAAANLINHNGMGLASGGGVFDQVTMPIMGLDSNDPRLGTVADAQSDPFFTFDTNANDIANAINVWAGDDEVYGFTGFDFTDPNNTPNMYDPTGSVFRRYDDTANTPTRNEFVDYVDNNGDGIATNYRYQGNPEKFTTDARRAERAGMYLDTDQAKAESETLSTLPVHPVEGGPDPNKPWDRIVALENISLDSNLQSMDNIQTVDDVARLVLRGGILPNYPERDRIDNDGDGGYVTTSERGGLIVPIYVPGTLDKDMVDNDNDGIIDEYAPGTDGDGDGYIDDTDFDGDLFDEIRVDLSEGVDEGKPVFTQTPLGPLYWRRYGPGSYDVPINTGLTTDNVDVLPATFLNVRESAPLLNDYINLIPGTTVVGFGAGNIYEYMTTFQADADPASFVKGINANFFDPNIGTLDRLSRLGDSIGNPFASIGSNDFITEDAHYLGSDLDPPDWKEFAERRWNPGDNVIVSLLDTQGRVADRVTYRELDVTNRTIDDIMPSPYVLDIDGDTNFNHLANDPIVEDRRDSLHPNYASFWRPNHMGLDFYRSLERKHPTYTGDRFGTSNRWEATDGNYDDWAESPSFFEAFSNAADFPPSPNTASRQFELRLASAPVGTIVAPATYIEHERLYRHAMYGSPLRANLTHRISENTTDMVRRLHALGDFSFSYIEDRQYTPLDDPRYADQFYAVDDQYIGLNATGNFGNSVLDAELVTNSDWSHTRAGVRNRPYTSVGELALLPGLSFQHPMVNPVNYAANPRVTWLNDVTRENTMYTMELRGALRPRVRQNLTQRGATLGYDETNAEPEPNTALARFGASPNPLDTAVSMMSTDSLVLTVGQADFMPVRPNPFDTDTFLPGDYPTPREFTGSDYQDLMAWVRPSSGAGDTTPLVAPAVWTPVFLFELPGDFTTDASSFPPGRFPFYPSFPGGENVIGFAGEGIGLVPNDLSVDRKFWPMQFIFNSNYLFEDRQASFSMNLTPAAMKERWPLEERTVMYVAEQRNISPGVPMDDDERAEAVFTWTAEDGLENGEYILYIGTFIPELNKHLVETPSIVGALSTESLVTPVGTTGMDAENVPVEPYVAIDPTTGYSFGATTLAALDPDTSVARSFEPQLGIDVITDRTRARGLAPRVVNPVTPEEIAARAEFEATGVLPPGLAHPDDWQPSTIYRPGSDGYIFYSDSGEGGWKPILVRVTDNYLALRVRNMGQPGEVAAISHVVLAPRKRSTGTINVNTVTPTVLAKNRSNGLGAQFYLLDSLLGLPGVVDTYERAQVPTESIGRTDDVGNIATALVTGAKTGVNQARPGPSTMANNALMPPVRFGGVDFPTQTLAVSGTLADSATARAQLSALILEGRERHLGSARTEDAQHYDGRYYKRITDLVKDSSSYAHPNPAVPSAEAAHIYPLSNQNDPELRFDESTERFRRMSNLITTRSDVFEIIATVQAGYGVDQNGDGRINYRSSEEFVTTAETKTRMVYERRSPSDSSDINDATD